MSWRNDACALTTNFCTNPTRIFQWPSLLSTALSNSNLRWICDFWYFPRYSRVPVDTSVFLEMLGNTRRSSKSTECQWNLEHVYRFSLLSSSNESPRSLNASIDIHSIPLILDYFSKCHGSRDARDENKLRWNKQLRRNSTAAGTGREVVAGQRDLWRHAGRHKFLISRRSAAENFLRLRDPWMLPFIFAVSLWHSATSRNATGLAMLVMRTICAEIRENNDVSGRRNISRSVPSPRPPLHSSLLSEFAIF